MPLGIVTTLLAILLLALGTLGSEDLTCVSAGQLIAVGQIHWPIAVAGCFVGIYVGDLGVWLLGRVFGRRVLALPLIARRVSPERLDHLATWFDHNAVRAIVVSRFVPGTRVPLYLAAGTLGRSGARFALWTFVATALWTPAIILLVARFGERFTTGRGSVAFALVVILAYAALQLVMLTLTEVGRAKLVARVSLLWRWEFWPTWLFYAPLVPWVAWLALRHRSFSVITAANPGILHGGFVGESKFQILSKVDSSNVLPTELIDAPDLDARLKQLYDEMQRHGMDYPIILKPDVGQRGAGVKLIRDRETASRHLASTGDQKLIVQPYHPGPYEAGIFYYRIPGEQRGRIFSMTDKQFAHVVGDGASTLEQLIWRDSRLRMQATTFLKRHTDHVDQVLSKGQKTRLGVAGNHCQGTLFRDGSHLIAPQLERAIDRVAQTFDGFYFGRFDVRYRDVDEFKAGRDLTIIELNGITSESTNVYDPSRSLLWAYRTLLRQWSILFRIGEANRRLGHRPSRLGELMRDVIAYYTSARAPTLSD